MWEKTSDAGQRWVSLEVSVLIVSLVVGFVAFGVTFVSGFRLPKRLPLTDACPRARTLADTCVGVGYLTSLWVFTAAAYHARVVGLNWL